MKRLLIILLILAAVIGIAVAGYRFASPPEPPALADDPAVEIVPVRRETLVDSVSATGRIEPKAEVEMKFETGGMVKEVLAATGRYVPAGEILARLDTAGLELEITRARIDLAQQEAELKKLFEPELAEKIASAQAQVESARLKLDELLDGPDPDEVAQAKAELSLKQIALKKAQWDYDQVAYRGDIGAMLQADALQEATLAFEIAQAAYNLKVKGPTPAQIAEARATLASAQATLAELLREPSGAEIAARQAAVDKARLTLAEKQADLDRAVLTAPTGGLILEVNIEPGERVLNDATQAAIVLGNTSAYLLKVEVDEIDIGRIRQGQEAAIVLDAFANREFTGVVTDISPRPVNSNANAIVTYEVTITLNTGAEDPGLLSGMTATATIETGRREGVVVVPNRAVQIERERDRPLVFVEKLDSDGRPARVEVELGQRNGSVIEVVSGLEEGDQVVIRNRPEAGPTPNL